MKQVQKFRVSLRGIRPIMFDRYRGMKATEISPEKKFYYNGNETDLVFPAENLHSFLSAEKSATRRVMGKMGKNVALAALSFVDISPAKIPFMRDGEQLTLENSGWYVDERVARVKKGPNPVPSEKIRPVIPLPWGLTFELSLFPNGELGEDTLRHILEDGGLCEGLGTFRGVFGKFVVDKWEKL